MRITANQISTLRIVCLPIPVWLLYQGSIGQWVAIALFILLGVTDYLDGYLARKYGSTEFGKYLDPISDKIFMAAMLLPIIHLGVMPAWPIVLVIIREFAVTDLRTIYNTTGASFETSMAGKFKTNVQIFSVVMALMNLLLAGTKAMLVIPMIVVLPFFMIALYTFVRSRTIHPYIVLLISTMPIAFVLWPVLSPLELNYVYALAILGFAAYSGAEYFIGGWKHLVSYIKEAPIRRLTLFLTTGGLVPVVFTWLMIRGIQHFWIPILIVSLEFFNGGLDNFLSMHGSLVKGWIRVVKLAGQLIPAAICLMFYKPEIEYLLFISLAVTLAYSLGYAFFYRKDIAKGTRPTSAS